MHNPSHCISLACQRLDEDKGPWERVEWLLANNGHKISYSCTIHLIVSHWHASDWTKTRDLGKGLNGCSLTTVIRSHIHAQSISLYLTGMPATGRRQGTLGKG